MGIVAIVPVANLAAANASLQAQGFGPGNFSVPAYGATGATHAALHAWDDPAFSAAIKAVAGVVFNEGTGDPVTRTNALIVAQGAKWGDKAPDLPASGNATAGTLYRFTDASFWWCIQTFNRTTYPAHPSTYPALIRRMRRPGERLPWVQPTDQYDAYKLLNPFTNKPDECTFGGKSWKVSQADGSGNNVWQPGAFGWVEVT